MQTGLTQEQLALRKQGLGSSDIAAVAGLSPWATPIDVWLDKTGRAPFVTATPAMRRGIYLEPLIGELYTERTGIELDKGTTVIDPDASWRLCTPDFLAKLSAKLIEAKAPARDSDKWGEDGSSQIPEYYAVQVQWQLGIVRLSAADLAALIGNDFRVYPVPADPEMFGLLSEIGERFWKDNVLGDKMPEVTASDRDLAYIRQRYPVNTASMLDATAEMEELARDLFAGQTVMKIGEARFNEAKNKLCALIGTAGGVKGDGWKITWKKSRDGERVDWKAVAQELNAPIELVLKHTTIKEGSRRFLPSQKGGK